MKAVEEKVLRESIRAHTLRGLRFGWACMLFSVCSVRNWFAMSPSLSILRLAVNHPNPYTNTAKWQGENRSSTEHLHFGTALRK